MENKFYYLVECISILGEIVSLEFSMNDIDIAVKVLNSPIGIKMVKVGYAVNQCEL